jgi:hypothetical protein
MKMKVLILVKTYPAISSKYGETVCTAGITEDGKWIRIYPLPFRKIPTECQFKKYDWIEIDLKHNESDFRPESFRPNSFNDIKVVGHIEADGKSWYERRKYVLKNVYTNLAKLIKEAKAKEICTSLAVFKPTKIVDFTIEESTRNWDKKKLHYLESVKLQGSLFENENEHDIENFEVVDKVPYKFSFEFEDDSGVRSKLMNEDWEVGALYWNTLKDCKGNEKEACEKVREKYFNDFAKTKDYYFYLGTQKKHHFISPNPFIIGDFHPKFIEPNLFD